MPSFGIDHVVQTIGNMYIGGTGIKHHHDHELMNRLLASGTLIGSRWFEFLHTWKEGPHTRSALRRYWMTPGTVIVWLCVPPYRHGQPAYHEHPGRGLIMSVTFRELNKVIPMAAAAGFASHLEYTQSSASTRQQQGDDQGNDTRARSKGRTGPTTSK
jgi:hypothetical protein